jgi:hypothetical protein
MIVFYQFTEFEKYFKNDFWAIPFSLTPSFCCCLCNFSTQIPLHSAQAFGSTTKIE